MKQPMFGFLVIAGLLLNDCAIAMDVPMDRALAATKLDSKTCYSEIQLRHQLVAIELQDLMISQGGRLVTMKADGNFEVGDKNQRKYTSGKMEITITPLTTVQKGDSMVFEIREKAKMTITTKGKKPIKHDVDVFFNCSP